MITNRPQICLVLGKILVEFVAKTPGPEWEDNLSTIILRDSKEGPPKPKIKTLMEYFIPTEYSSYYSALWENCTTYLCTRRFLPTVEFVKDGNCSL